MNRLLIRPRHLEAVRRHAAAAYPEEGCGFLLGRSLEGDEGVLVERVLPVHNDRQEGRRNRYLIEPRTVLAAHKEARSQDLEVVGIYHSHPDHPASPSEFDREHAWPGWSYLIVGVERGEVAEVRSWRLGDDRGGFEEEALDDLQVASLPASREEAVV